jgi:uncharacterized protein
METSKANLILREGKVFAKCPLPAKTKIFEFSGDVLTTNQLATRHPSDVVDFLQIGIDKWISKSGTFDDYIAHSCNPNCYVKVVGNRAILTTLYNILPMMEICWDYSTTSTENLLEWSMDCKCGYVRCRKVISGIQSVPVAIQQEYERMGILPDYVLAVI